MPPLGEQTRALMMLEGRLAEERQSHGLTWGCHTGSRAILTGDCCFTTGRARRSRPSHPERKEGGDSGLCPELGSTGVFRERHDCRSQSELGVVTMSPAGGAGRRPEFPQGPGQKVDGETQNQGPGKVKQSGLEEAMGPVDSLSHLLL